MSQPPLDPSPSSGSEAAPIAPWAARIGLFLPVALFAAMNVAALSGATQEARMILIVVALPLAGLGSIVALYGGLFGMVHARRGTMLVGFLGLAFNAVLVFLSLVALFNPPVQPGS